MSTTSQKVWRIADAIFPRIVSSMACGFGQQSDMQSARWFLEPGISKVVSVKFEEMDGTAVKQEAKVVVEDKILKKPSPLPERLRRSDFWR